MPLEAQIEGHVVDAAADVVDLFDRDADILGKLLCGALDAMAEAYDRHLARAVPGPGVHRHRVDVVQEDGARLCDRFDVRGDALEDGNGAQGPEYATDTEGVCDCLCQTVLFGNVEVSIGRRVAADL